MSKNIPHGWKESPIFEVAPIESKLVDPKLDEYSQLTLIAPDHIQQKSGQLIAKKTASEQSAISGKYLVLENDVIYSKIRPYLMKAVISPERCLCSADMYPLHCNGEIEPRYLHSILLSDRFTYYANSCSARTGIPKLNREDMGEYVLTLPPLPEQKAIAALLSTWDEAIEKTERMIQAKEKRFKWLLRELISDQCVEQNQGSEWKSYRLGKFIVERNEKSTAHDQHPVLTSSRKGLFYQSDYFSKQVTSSDNEGYKIVNKGDFTYRAMSDDGKFAFNRLDFCNHGIISPAYGVFYPKNINSDFLLFFMNSSAFFREVLKESQGGTRISLKLNAMKKNLVSIPSIEKQNQIADTLTSAQREIDLLKQLADKYNTQKRGLMQKMLTGEWRVKPEIVNQYMEA